MARCLKRIYIGLTMILLIVPLVCNGDEDNNGSKEVRDLLQKLLNTVKERRTMSDDNPVNASGQGQTTDETPQVEFQKQKGMNINDVKVGNVTKERIVQDCESKYELVIDNSLDEEGGKCFLRKMNDIVYEKNCNLKGNVGELKIMYVVGPEINDSTILSTIKGSEPCKEKPLFEMTESSVQKRSSDDHEKMVADTRFSCYCGYYYQYCYSFCVRYSWSWWSKRCVQYGFICECRCGYYCG